jgi:MauM/NapG family ferredoxin protein
LSQLIFFALFLVIFFWLENTFMPGSLSNVFIRLDPFTSILSMLAAREFLIGSALSLLLLVLAIAFGRVWCGWICPLGTSLDWISLRRLRVIKVSIPERWRVIKHWILLFSFGTALMGGLTLLFLDPLTIWVRSMHLAVLPGLDYVVTGLERLLYPIPALGSFVSQFDRIIRPTLLPPEAVQVRFPGLFSGFFLGILVMNLAAERFWCRYLCPLGALLGFCSKAAIIRRSVGEGCRGCVLCTDACPMATIDPARGYESDPAECTVCMDCVDACPRGETNFVLHHTTVPFMEYDPTRRQALLAMGAGAAAIGALRMPVVKDEVHPYRIHPPGAQHDAFLAKCVRCGLCMQVCPTSGLQPAMLEAGIEGFWTPVLVARLGSCDYGCNACGQVCPVEAIQPLPLEVKREQVIGKAIIDEDRCIPWAEERDCIVCEEMCPLPEKAIELQEVELVDDDGLTRRVLQPVVMHQRCIGCGICEQKCPVEGEAAIRVVHIDHLGRGSGGGQRPGVGQNGNGQQIDIPK